MKNLAAVAAPVGPDDRFPDRFLRKIPRQKAPLFPRIGYYDRKAIMPGGTRGHVPPSISVNTNLSSSVTESGEKGGRNSAAQLASH